MLIILPALDHRAQFQPMHLVMCLAMLIFNGMCAYYVALLPSVLPRLVPSLPTWLA